MVRAVIRARDVLGPGSPLSQALPGWEHREGQLAMAEAVERALERGAPSLRRGGNRDGQDARVPRAGGAQRAQGRRLDGDAGAPGADLRQGPADRRRGARRARRHAARGAHEGPRQLRLPAPPRRGARVGRTRRWTRALGAHRRLGPDDRDAATAPSSRTCRRTPRSGATSRRRARRASAPAASTSTRASSRGCGARPRTRRSSSSTTTSSSPTWRCAPGRRGAHASVLPAYDAVVFDEAHQIEDVATDFFGVRVSSARVEALVRDAERALASANALEALKSGPVAADARERARGVASALRAPRCSTRRRPRRGAAGAPRTPT